MKGQIIFKGKTYDYDGVNDLPLQAVKAYSKEFPNSTIKDAMDFFRDGLKGGAKNLIIEVSNYPGKRYITRETIQLRDSSGTKVDCYVSSEFGNSGPNANLPLFVEHLWDCGFEVTGYSSPCFKTPVDRLKIVCGYNIINVRTNPILKNLREDLFDKNLQAFDFMDYLDDSNILKNEGFCNTGMCINEALINSKYILFSSDKPTATYGKYNKGDLIKAIGDLLSKIDNSLLNKEQKNKLKGKIKKLLERILQYNNDEQTEEKHSFKEAIDEIERVFSDIGIDIHIPKDILDSKEELEKTIKSLKFTEPIGGIYFDGDYNIGPCIIIFLNNILNKPQGNENFEEYELYNPYPNINKDIERTYVHELFHMIHLGMELLAENNDYADEVIVEGLARYFDIKYCERYFGTNADSELNYLFDNYSVVSYPYVGACYIERFGKNRFGEIVEKSTHGNHMALHCLIQGTKELEIIIKEL